MGSLDTYLFGPTREPINEHIPRSVAKWSLVFSSDQAATYDQKGWPYYTGEWFENLYPGYSNYAEYKGIITVVVVYETICFFFYKNHNGYNPPLSISLPILFRSISLSLF